jgi:uncharacterized protein YprB with RNaseH-like and TPR domain
MLRHTFCHLPGIGPISEQRLWQRGCTTLDDLQRNNAMPWLARATIAAEVAESIQRFAAADFEYYASRLPGRERWRLFFEARISCAYVDIVTTGLGSFADITTVAIYDGRCVHTFVAGQNLDEVPAVLKRFDLLVTYNGASFDIPILEHWFGIRLTKAHIDLRHVLASLGLKGGLKGVERRLGLERRGMEELDGYFAVLLWHEYQRTSDPAVLHTLLAYNAQDVLNLEYLMVEAYNRKVALTPFTHLVQPRPTTIANPFTPDAEVIARLRRQQFSTLYGSW